VAFGKRVEKQVIVVRDGVGFYTSQILVPYINKAVHILAEGGAVEAIDAALADFGFPVGPINPNGRGRDRRGRPGWPRSCSRPTVSE
jgi:3-hydroxyacyl-CoA dehydrogenase